MPSGSKLRILTVTHNYPRFPGDPAGAFVARIAEGVASQGHEVRVLAPHAAGLKETEQPGPVMVRRFRYAPDSLERVAYTGGLHQGTLRSPIAAAAFPGFLLAFGAALRREVHHFQPDLIHAHWWFPSGWFSARSGVPYLVTCHGSDVRLLDRGALVRRIARHVLSGAAAITTVSRFLADDLARLVPQLRSPVRLTPMPIDVASFQLGQLEPKARPPRILYAGNLVPSKGVDLLLQAAARLSAADVRYQLKILGGGSAQSALQSLARELGIGDRVEWSFFVPQSRMPQEYGASTVTVLPTRGRAEGLGLTLVEALLAGSAVVGTRTGGIPEVVRHEETGLLAREDPADLATQIQRLLEDPDLRARLVGAGKELTLRTYSPDIAIARFLELYDAAAHGRTHN